MADERPLPTRIWTVEDYHRVKEFYEARGLVFNPALEYGSPAALHVIAQLQLQKGRERARRAGDNELIQRLLAGPDDTELSPRDLAFLEAYLEQPASLGQSQQDGREQGNSPSAQRRSKLKLVRDFNRILNATKGTALSAQSTTATKPANAAPVDTASDLPAGFLDGAALARALGVHVSRRDAFVRQLGRMRRSLDDDCWHEVRESRPNGPRFLYRANSPKLLALAAHYKKPKQR